ncbi:MAG: hypothetical protein KDK39_11155 [Leptospiraceae bacterium]|nr:hypothetical protein [Leptospiraceae bacterium]
MITPFADHPIVREFNKLRKFFLLHESKESRNRIGEFRKFSYVIQKAGLEVAFDFVGSMNFGQSAPGSDVDLILYLECETYHHDCIQAQCKTWQMVHDYLLDSLIREYADQPYNLQIIDAINLKVLMDDLILGRSDSDTLLRFAFYRSICRSVNSTLLRPYQERLLENQLLLDRIRPHIVHIFDSFTRDASHNISMRKYQERLQDDGVRIPPSVRRRIRWHLDSAQRYRDQEANE